MRLLMTLALAVAIAAAIGVLDSHASEVQPAVLLILVGSAVFAAAYPRLAWAWAFIFGTCIVFAALAYRALGLAAAAPPEPNVAAGLLALIPASIGAAAGALTRWAVGSQGQRRA